MTGNASLMPARSIPAPLWGLAGLMLVAALPAPASAASETFACYTEETGAWVNPRPRKGDVARIEVESKCDGDRLAHRARTFTKCAPRNCSWGWTPAEKIGSRPFMAVFATYSAYRFVEMKVNGNRMDIYVTYDFHDDRKSNAAYSFVLHRAED